MTQSLQRLILFAALALEGVGPVRAAPPKHPPLPPERPVFPDDPPQMPLDPNAPQAAAPDAVTPQGVYQQASLEGSTAVAQSSASSSSASSSSSPWPFGGLVVPAQPAQMAPPVAAAEPPPAPVEPEPTQRVEGLRASAEPNYDRVPPREAGPYDPRTDKEHVAGFEIAEKAGLADMTRKYARKNGVPLALLHRIIMRESKYCPRLVNHGRYYGLMQISPATARSMGYHGAPKGLLDPETNLTYATAYLANAWAVSGGDMDRAVRLYASGYYYTAKNKGMLDQMRDGGSPPVNAAEALAIAAPPPPPPSNIFEAMFGGANR